MERGAKLPIKDNLLEEPMIEFSVPGALPHPTSHPSPFVTLAGSGPSVKGVEIWDGHSGREPQ